MPYTMAEKDFDPNDLPGRQLKNGCVEIMAIHGLERLPQLNGWLGGCFVRANLAEVRHGVSLRWSVYGEIRHSVACDVDLRILSSQVFASLE